MQNNFFNKILNKKIKQSIAVTKRINKDKTKIFSLICKIEEVLDNKGKLLICVNGVSAADSHHIAT